jgi:flavin reductase (DIM6/NTAB) family NADH-FMN oxidoreductase RutF
MEIPLKKARPELISPMTIITVGNGKRNGFTASLVSMVSSFSDPPLLMVSVWKSNFSCGLIKEQKEFAINTISKDQIELAKLFGSKSGRDLDKFKETGVETFPASKIKAPLIKESPVSLECKVIKQIDTGDCVTFIAKLVAALKNNDKRPMAWFQGKYTEIRGMK